MKKIVLIVIFSLFTLAACSDSSTNNNNNNNNSNDPGTVKIGDQIWTLSNLNVDHYLNGDSIPEVRDYNRWITIDSGAWCYYNNDPAMGKIYGKLYNWRAISDKRGIAPKGWHVSTVGEWNKLYIALGNDTTVQSKLKESGLAHWLTPNTGATNSSGFTALPSGRRASGDGKFFNIGKIGFWWCYDKNDIGFVNNVKFLSYNNDNSMVLNDVYAECGFAVRCVKD